MITLIVAFIFFTILILGHELGHFLTAKFFGLKVEEFGFGFPPRIFSRFWRGTKYSFNLIPFGGFVKIYGEDNRAETLENEKESFRGISAWKRAVVVTSGVLMNILIGYLAFAFVFMIGIPTSVFISSVIPGSPAEAAGFKAGDELEDFKKREQFINFVNENGGQEIQLDVLRENKKLTLNVVPRETSIPGEGRLGLYLAEAGIPKHNFFEALGAALTATLEATQLIFSGFVSLFGGLFRADLESLKSVAGPVGIFGILGSATQLGIQYLLHLLALISLNLAVLNLLPFPALDGGRLFFVAIEKISGRRVSYKSEAIAHTIGFAILFVLMTIVTLHDIIKIL